MLVVDDAAVGDDFAEASHCACPFAAAEVNDPKDAECVPHFRPEAFRKTVEEDGFDGLLRAYLLALMLRGVHIQLAADVDDVVNAVDELMLVPCCGPLHACVLQNQRANHIAGCAAVVGGVRLGLGGRANGVVVTMVSRSVCWMMPMPRTRS